VQQPTILSILKLGPSYVFQWQLPGPAHTSPVLLTALSSSQKAGPNLSDQVEKTARLLHQLIVHRAPAHQTGEAVTLDPLQSLGRLIYNRWPRVIQEALEKLPAGSSLVLATNDPELPWELSHDVGAHRDAPLL
jgi:hypothetical protein